MVEVGELQERIEAAARTVHLRLGPNATEQAKLGIPIPLSGTEASAVADAVIAAVTAAITDATRAARADAWDEGWEACSTYETTLRDLHGAGVDEDFAWLAEPTNPHRQRAEREGPTP